MSATWWEGRMVAFDVESGGIDVFNDRIVTAAVVHIIPGERPRTLTWVIDSGVPVPAEASAIHGWTTERIKAYRDAKGRPARAPDQAIYEVAGQVALALSMGVPVVAFNACFDLSMLEAENRRHNLPTIADRLGKKPISPIIDPFVLDKHVDPYRKGKRTLDACCAHYKVTLAGAHSCDADGIAAARLVPVMVRAHTELQTRFPSQLHTLQVGWRAEQQASLATYFRRQGNVDAAGSVCGEWPVQTPDLLSEVAS